MAKKVFIGVGHGGSDPGAVANGFKEKDLNLSVALACQDELARHGVLTRMSRTKDDSESLTEKVNECNAFSPDLAIDIHNNAGGGDGAEVFHHHGGGTGKTLAVNILDEVVKIGQNSRGAKVKTNSSGKDAFVFIRNTSAPAVIVECAFVDNANDIQIIDTVAEQVNMGIAIAKGILKTLGIAYKEATTTTNESKGESTVNITLNVIQKGAKGEQVKALQRMLYAMGYSIGSVDGDFGSKTDAAVRAYQKNKGLTADGIVGAQTWNKLLKG